MACRSIGQTSLESVEIFNFFSSYYIFFLSTDSNVFSDYALGRRPLYNLIVISFRYTGGRSSETKKMTSARKSMAAVAAVSARSSIESQIIQWKFNGVKIEREQLDNCFRIFSARFLWLERCLRQRMSKIKVF